MKNKNDALVGLTAAGASIVPAWAISTMNAAQGLPTTCTGVCGSCGGSCLSGLGIFVLLGAGLIRKAKEKKEHRQE